MRKSIWRTSLWLSAFLLPGFALAQDANSATVTVSPQAVLRTVDPRMYGINLALWDDLLMDSITESSVRPLRMGSFRFPGGSLSDDYDWQTDRGVTSNQAAIWVNPVSNFAKFIETQKGAAYVTVNYGSGTPEQAAAWVAYSNGNPSSAQSLGIDAKGRDWRTVGYWATIRASGALAADDGYNFLRVSHPDPYHFKYWEIGNECYGSWEVDQHGAAGSGLTGSANDGLTYARYFKAFYHQMLAVDPTICIGAVITDSQDSYPGSTKITNPADGTSHSGWTPVVLSTLQSLGITPDFVIDHYYAQNPGQESDSVLMRASSVVAGYVPIMRKMVNDYLGTSAGGQVEIVLTELNSVSYNPGKQSTNLVNGLFFADCYGALAGTEINACLWWDLHNSTDTAYNLSSALYGWRQFGGYDILANRNAPGVPLNTPLPTYYASKLLTHWARGGDQVVAATSNNAVLSAYASRLANGHLALLVINKSAATDIATQISLVGYRPSSSVAEVYVYGKDNDAQGSTNPDVAAYSIATASSSFGYTFASYSMTVIDLAPSADAPTITSLPVSQTVAPGGTAVFTVGATSATGMTYQWYKDGVALPGQNGASLILTGVQNADAGAFSVQITNANGSVTSFRAILAIGTGVRLINVSMRGNVASGDATPIVGFALAGTGQETIVMQAAGPFLGTFNSIANPIADPAIRLFDSNAQLAQNEDWDGTPATAALFAQSGSFIFPVGSKDAALTPSLSPGAYTIHLLASNGSSGVGLMQLNALDSQGTARLINISARARVGTGQNVLIAGFVITGAGKMDVLVRGVGPTLANFQLPASSLLANPSLTVNNSDGAVVASNDDWEVGQDGSAIAAVTSHAGVWTLPTGSLDSALVVSLAPGAYTAVLSGVNNTTGVALVEVYEVH